MQKACSVTAITLVRIGTKVCKDSSFDLIFDKFLGHS